MGSESWNFIFKIVLLGRLDCRRDLDLHLNIIFKTRGQDFREIFYLTSPYFELIEFVITIFKIVVNYWEIQHRCFAVAMIAKFPFHLWLFSCWLRWNHKLSKFMTVFFWFRDFKRLFEWVFKQVGVNQRNLPFRGNVKPN